MISDDIRQLYQNAILEHGRKPRNFGKLAHANRILEGNNPLCGDRFQLYLQLEDDHILDASFEGHGCAISTASASMMTEHIKHKTCQQARTLFGHFDALTRQSPEEHNDNHALGELNAFAGLAEYPSRIKCANLIWHTLNAALMSQTEAVTTE